MEVASLEPRIREILTAPGTDLTTISAKRVRRQLWEDDDSSVTEEYIRSNKDQVDRLIESVYESVNYATGETEVTSSPKAMKRKRERSDDGTNTVNDVPDADRSSTAPPPSKSKSKSAKPRKDGISDEEYARQLSSELNKRESRSSRAIGVKSSGSKSKNGASRTSKKSKKSATEVDEDGNEIKAEGGGAKGGFAKELILSDHLSAVLGVDRLSRPQVVKRLWEYIKGHDLQNPDNRKEIMCDERLRAVFNTDRVDMFKMNKILGQHLHPIE